MKKNVSLKKLVLNKATIINLNTMGKVKGGEYTDLSTCCPKVSDRPALCPAYPLPPGDSYYCNPVTVMVSCQDGVVTCG